MKSKQLRKSKLKTLISFNAGGINMPFGSIDLLCGIREKETLTETLTSHFRTKEAIVRFMTVRTIPHRKIHTYEHLIGHCLDYLHQPKYKFM